MKKLLLALLCLVLLFSITTCGSSTSTETTEAIVDYKSYHEVLMNLKKEHTKKRNFTINRRH